MAQKLKANRRVSFWIFFRNHDSQLFGVAVRHDNYPGLPHIFWTILGLPILDKFHKNLISGIDFVSTN